VIAATASALCRHCGSPSGAASFCCTGCEVVFALLQREGLTRYYELRDPADARPVSTGTGSDRKWLEASLTRAGDADLAFDIQGIQCTACVWLIEELFRRTGQGRIVVNPARGSLRLAVGADFDLLAFVTKVEGFGYRLGPPRKHAEVLADDVLWRLGVCAALAMNSMLFAIAHYAGLELSTGRVGRFVSLVMFGLAALAVVVGGAPFYRSAILALRQRTLHLDLPIALGLTLAFAGSTAALLGGHPERAYFDTVVVFVTLMLLGRFLQQRLVARNRRALLESDEVDGLLTRVVRGGRPEIVACREVDAGEELLVAPGDLVCVDAVATGPAACSLDWVNGESSPRSFAAGETIPAGAANAGTSPFRARALGGFGTSLVRELLVATERRGEEIPRSTRFWQNVTRGWVVIVLATAGLAFAGWLIAGAGVARALDVTTGILVVTCPCAFGIATPLAYEMVMAGLRRHGLFVRTAGFLDRALAVTRIAFDKTGTLTTGQLRLEDDAPLRALSETDRQALFDLAAQSSHPASGAVRQALEAAAPAGLALSPDTVIVETPGCGLALVRDGRQLRLGAAAWITGEADAGSLVFADDDRVLCRLRLVEDLRPDAAVELAALAREGIEVAILSGDTPARVAAAASALGIPADRAHGGKSPFDKRTWLLAHRPEQTLAIGDGLNDAPLFDAALCSGTPSIDRPFLPARSDFYFVTAGLRPVRLALLAARRLRRVVRRNLAMAITYNVGTVALATAGVLSPLLCAVVMPLSSLSVVLATAWALAPRSPLWKS
jgi:P-type Cu2+ transporter